MEQFSLKVFTNCIEDCVRRGRDGYHEPPTSLPDLLGISSLYYADRASAIQ